MDTEALVVRKDSTILFDERYKTPNTSMLIFHFEPKLFASVQARVKNCKITHTAIANKDIYLFDNFFTHEEGDQLRAFSKNAAFSRSSYGSQESRAQGEEPAKSMNNKEKWVFFANPPSPVKEVYKLFASFAKALDADVTTLPWDLCNTSICASAFATNYLEKMTPESMEMGKHEDYSPSEGLAFGIPILYSQETAYFPTKFANGEAGKPWLVTLMLYAKSEDFNSEYGMGTIFCNDDKSDVYKASCEHMRMVLFEGDIIHTIEESKIPSDKHPWRVSYVYKLIINPKHEKQSVKELFRKIYT